MLKTKSILAPKESSDGLRISIMSRHTLSDGTTPDSRITPQTYDLWGREFAPPDGLVGRYYKQGLSWEDFEKEYLIYLSSKEEQVRQLANQALTKDITLLCIEDVPTFCHRRLLAERCRDYGPSLEISLK